MAAEEYRLDGVRGSFKLRALARFLLFYGKELTPRP